MHTTPNDFTARLREIAARLDGFDGLDVVDTRERARCVEQLHELADLADGQPWTGTADLELQATS